MNKKIWIYLVLTFVTSAVFFITYKMFGDVWSYFSLLLAMLMPAVNVVVVQLLFKEKIKGRFLLKLRFNKFVILGILVPMLLTLYILLMNVLFTSSELGLDQVYVDQLVVTGAPEKYYIGIAVFSTLLNGLIAGVTLNAVFAFGEELGWRGFLQEEFNYMGPWKSSAIIGAIWGLWHAPLILQGYNFPDHPYIGVFMMIIATTFLGIIMSYLTKRSGTILTAVFFHGVLNAVAGLAIILTTNYVDIYHGPFGLTAIITYASVAGLLYLHEKRRMKKSDRYSTEPSIPKEI